MNKSSRMYKSVRNITFSVLSSFLIILLRFVCRTIFIRLLTTEYLGLNGLFANILSFLSLTELGIGSALNYALYKPLKENDQSLVKSLMNLYRRCYTIIGFTVLIAGSAIAPFLPLLIKDMPNIPHIYLYYMMYVVNSAVSYFFSYKRSLLVSDQNEYLVSVIHLMCQIVLNLLQILMLIITNNYAVYLIIMIFITICENIVISKIVNKSYPYLKERNVKPLNPDLRDDIKKNVKALFCHKVGSVIVFGTDNLIISAFLGLIEVGLYSNYTLITKSIDSLAAQIFNALTPSVGNLGVEQNKKHVEIVFNQILFINVWIYGFIAVCLSCLLQPFILLCWGSNYLLDNLVVLMISVNIYISGVRKTVLLFKDATGNFWYDRFKPFIESILNLSISVLFVKSFGISGVLMGTVCSSLLLPFWLEAYVLFKYYWGKEIGKYLLKQTEYAAVVFFASAICYTLCSIVQIGGIYGFLLKMSLVVIFSNVMFIIFWKKRDEFKAVMNMIKNLKIAIENKISKN